MIIAHFFGGPKDGETHEMPTDSPQWHFPALSDPPVYALAPDVDYYSIPARELIYRARGPELGGHRFYDYVDG